MARRARATYTVRVGPQGRVVIPAPVRRMLGLAAGDTMECRHERGTLVLKSRRKIERDLWDKFARVKPSLARQLIAERRREARRETKG